MNDVPFIQAKFTMDDSDLARMQDESGAKLKNVDSFLVTRFYDGRYDFAISDGALIEFPCDSVDGDEAEEPQGQAEEFRRAEPSDLEELFKPVMPRFVYYSNYGNLSSQIYLPHAIQWLNGKSVQRSEERRVGKEC